MASSTDRCLYSAKALYALAQGGQRLLRTRGGGTGCRDRRLIIRGLVLFRYLKHSDRRLEALQLDRSQGLELEPLADEQLPYDV